MAYTNTDTNMTTSTGLSAGMQTYYNRELLRTFEPNLVHLQFGDEHRMPPHSGLVMNMRKLIPLETNTKALSEGDPGESVMLAETEVTVQLQQYGEYARCTDKLDLTHLDMDIMRRMKLFGDAGARSIDAVVREELAKCANVIYANGKTSRASLTAADKLTSRELRKAVKLLKKNHAQTFGGYYVAIVGPDTMYDLQEDEAFVKVSQYQDRENIYTGEVGRLFGVRLVETTEAKVFEGAGASGADVASVIVLGQYAYAYRAVNIRTERGLLASANGTSRAFPALGAQIETLARFYRRTRPDDSDVYVAAAGGAIYTYTMGTEGWVKPNGVNWIGALIGAVLAWWTGLPPLAQALLIVQGADILTGLLCAVTGKSRKTESGKVSSGALMMGVLKKGFEWLVVGVCVSVGNGLGMTSVCGAAMTYMIATELVSLIENLEIFGLNVPLLGKLLDVAQGENKE